MFVIEKTLQFINVDVDYLKKAGKLYDRQMCTGKVVPFCCDFRLLEKACDEY